MVKKLLSLFFSVLFFLTPAFALEGMDISVFQGQVDFSAARSDGIEAVYIRSSYGSQGVDARFSANYAAARAAGLSFGFYHYLESTDPDGARREAEHFAALLRPLDYDCRPVLDFERYQSLDAEQASAVALAFLERLNALTGQTPMIYADSYAAAFRLGEAVAEYPLWLAQWDVQAPELSNTPWRQWAGWQYTDTGLVSGVTGYVDRDVFTDAIFLREEEHPFFYYTVQKGDTLWALAQRFGTTVEALAEDNQIRDPNLIYVNQVLRIPGVSPERTYTVQSGDTLWEIAQLYGTTVTQLVRLNSIQNPNLIYPGQILLLP